MKFIAILLALVASLPMVPFNRLPPNGQRLVDEAAGAAQNLLHSSNPSSHPIPRQIYLPNPFSAPHPNHQHASVPDSLQGILRTPAQQPRSFPDINHRSVPLPESFSSRSSSSSITSGSTTPPILSDYLSPKYSRELYLGVISDSPLGKGSKRAPQPPFLDNIPAEKKQKLNQHFPKFSLSEDLKRTQQRDPASRLFASSVSPRVGMNSLNIKDDLPPVGHTKPILIKDPDPDNLLHAEMNHFFSAIFPEDKYLHGPKGVQVANVDVENSLNNMVIRDNSKIPSLNSGEQQTAALPQEKHINLDQSTTGLSEKQHINRGRNLEPGLEFHTHHPIPKTIATKDRVGLHNLGFTEKEISAIDPTKFGLVKDQMEFNLDEIVNDELARGLMVDTIKP